MLAALRNIRCPERPGEAGGGLVIGAVRDLLGRDALAGDGEAAGLVHDVQGGPGEFVRAAGVLQVAGPFAEVFVGGGVLGDLQGDRAVAGAEAVDDDISVRGGGMGGEVAGAGDTDLSEAFFGKDALADGRVIDDGADVGERLNTVLWHRILHSRARCARNVARAYVSLLVAL